MAVSMSKIKPLHPELIPPEGAVPFGVTVDGHQLYKLVTPRSRAVPDLDENKVRRWSKNQMTGEPLLPQNKPEFYEKTEIFYLQSEGNGNARKIPYVEPTAAELAAAERSKKIAEMQDHLAEAFVDAGLSPEQAAARVVGPAAVVPAKSVPPVEAEPEVEYPFMSSPGRWTLSNGDVMKGKKVDAIEAEKAVVNAKEVAVATPEF